MSEQTISPRPPISLKEALNRVIDTYAPQVFGPMTPQQIIALLTEMAEDRRLELERAGRNG